MPAKSWPCWKKALIRKNAAARADIEQTQSQIRQAEANLAKYKVTAISDGIIVSKHFLEGDIVSAGSNLAEIASQQDKYLVTYVPEDYINNISYGQELAIYSGKTEYKGTVSFIDLKAQYTPQGYADPGQQEQKQRENKA